MKKSPTTQAKYAALMLGLLLTSARAQAQNVGIGTTTPQFKLDVRGNNPDDGILFSIGNSTNTHRLLLFSGLDGDLHPFGDGGWEVGYDL